MKPRRLFIFLVLLIIGVITAAFIGILNDAVRLVFVVWAGEVCDYLGDSEPWVFFTAFVILPLLGFPVFPFYLIAAELYGRVPSILLVGASLMVHLVIAFWIASRLFRGLISKLISRSRYHLPRIPSSEHVKLTVVLRITPGIPFFLQNYLLGLGGIAFRVFFFVSWPIQFLWGIAFILLGESAFEGNLSIGLMSVCFIIALLIVTKIVRERLANRLDEYETATFR
ncbi:MAG: hypothetical protein DF168_00053 [Candidatus Moanabacter tarae]|uniref:TVP38/TMEM64 family membrane protein n=1 Tax=Candidatus Moanibacter tarae TaxID=2200854 RepID=A0A2Z4AB15_9BACT|nr:MAG: hypothetical protein DF168_00053 [Candidatus Moanabacter tarae]